MIQFENNPNQINQRNFLIVGLGNPGKEFAQNRHNIGFMVLNQFASQNGLTFNRLEHQAFILKIKFADSNVILAKPQTYMNLSGKSVAALLHFYKIPLSNLLVVYDDIDLPFGTLRLRPNGSSGGHKGMQSIIERLGTQEFARLRIGIGRPTGRKEAANYVLEDFTSQEREHLPIIIDHAIHAILDTIQYGIDDAMNRHNAPLSTNP
ncbi:MAG: aminoacyl-tRNA hydrolase [Anaerolineales bacterium]